MGNGETNWLQHDECGFDIFGDSHWYPSKWACRRRAHGHIYNVELELGTAWKRI